jgi:hypothetical protein
MREICAVARQNGISFIVSLTDSRKNMKSKKAEQMFPGAYVWIIGAIGVLVGNGRYRDQVWRDITNSDDIYH